MPRTRRHVFPTIPHHITQRGNRREDVFFNDDDKQLYLEWLTDYCKKYQVELLSYCLMDNHIHLIMTPQTHDGLHNVLKPLHMRYAQYINRRHGWSGHLWQGRFFSSALDEAHTHAAIRYVERNPVEAGMVEKSEDYPWSSAAHHCGQTVNDFLMNRANKITGITEDKWSDWLAIIVREGLTQVLERNIEKGLPCGSDNFIERLEKLADRSLQYRPQGRPSKG
ncbi:hypothetical protein A9Q78_09305 [Methylophaga sp. 41_12_T18]|nr:hypothetical protein A9Q78_09305 [Methylophaga sp. 41_12_T18]